MNFEYTITSLESNKVSSYISLLKLLENKTYHWGIGGLYVTAERFDFIDCPSILFRDAYGTVYPYDTDSRKQLHYILKPFKVAVWCCLFTTILMLLIFFKFNPFEKNSSNSKFCLVKFRFRKNPSI